MRLLALAALAAPILHAGDVRWFEPGALAEGTVVRCIVGARTVTAKVPAPPAPGAQSGTDIWRSAGIALSIDQHADGRAQVACGSTTSTLRRRADLPYVISQNGLGRIRGANRLAALAHVYGRASLRPGAAGCRATWPALGLRATFAGSCARPGALRSATVTDVRWSSLSGAHVGDSVAQLRWEVPQATPLGPRRWLLSPAGHGSSRLVAAADRNGEVTGLVCTVG
jgi:hypothetical protein